jgi:hypothetical protein
MGVVPRASRSQRRLAKSTVLTCLEAGDADLSRHAQEDHEIEAGNEEVAPATQRSREDPARVGVQGRTQQRVPLRSCSGLLKRRHRRLPEVVVGIQMEVSEGLRERVPQC